MSKSAMGLGTFPFSNVFGRVDSSEADRIVNTFLDGGGKYIQTAPYYVGVDSLMGSILSNISRDRFEIATLCVKDRQSNIAGSRGAVFSQCDDSLSNLGLDYLDVYLTSTPEGSDVPFEETIGAMIELKEQGKVRQIGVCNVSLSELNEYNLSGAVEFVQNRFSLLDQEADREVRNFCALNDIGLIPYNVIEWGLLTSKVLAPFVLRGDDVRRLVLPVFDEERVQEVRAWVRDELLPIAERRQTTIEGLAIAWVLSQPSVAVAPVGATSNDQIQSSQQANALVEDHEVTVELDSAYQKFVGRINSKYGLTVNQFLRNSYGLW